jgi:hypothetical protein
MDYAALNTRIDCWFGWPWNDVRNAAAFTCELIRCVIPESAAGPDPVINDDDDGPYRSRACRPVDAEPNEVFGARCSVDAVLGCLGKYIAGQEIHVPAEDLVGFGAYEARSQVYWYARLIGDRARRSAELAAAAHAATIKRRFDMDKIAEEDVPQAQLAQRWVIIGAAAFAAVEFIQKQAVRQPDVVGGAPDGTGNAILGRITRSILLTAAGRVRPERFSILNPNDVQRRVIDWRIRDATRGRAIPQEIIEDLHDAFEAAWMAGKFAFGYSLLDAPDLQREDKVDQADKQEQQHREE